MKKGYNFFLTLFVFSNLQLWSSNMGKTRSEVSEQDRWNVEALYPTTDDWKKEFEELCGKNRPRWPDLKRFEGKLKDSPEGVSRFLDAYFDLDRSLSKLYVYAHLRLDEDLGNDSLKNHFGLISALIHDFQLEYSWVEPELLSLSAQQFQDLVDHPRLESYRFFLEKIGRMRPHTLSYELEEMLALSGKALEAPYKAFGALNNADLEFAPAETSDGEKKDLTTGTYLVYLRDSDRTLRRTAFENLHQAFEKHANTICELLQGQVQAHWFSAKAKKFQDCREAALFPKKVDHTVYDHLIASIHENFPILHEYIALRKQLLRLDTLHPYDLYIPLVDEVETKIDFRSACDLVVESVQPLGQEYAKELKKGLLEDRWVDPYENQAKRSGAYSSGCYDSMPYILMNYHGTLNDVLTLAHEAGHSMHSFLSRKHQPYIYADYPIFVAEVASTFNEQLLLQLLKDRAVSKKERAYLINYEIEAIRTTIFRQTLFAEFELQLHRWAEAGVPLTPTLLKEAYVQLNRDYYGPELVLDGGIAYEWARIPHFYYNFYVYQYATGLSAALSLFESASQSTEAKERYLAFLSSGGSRYPLDLLELAGVDLKSKSAVDKAMMRFKTLVQELKSLLDE